MKIDELLRLRIFYEKTGISRFISHKSFCKLIERSLRRAEVPILFSGNFTPRIKISFGPSLPVLVSGLNEFFEIEMREFVNFKLYTEKMNSFLPEGSKINYFKWVKNKFSLSKVKGIYFVPKEIGLSLKNEIEKYGKIIGQDQNYIKAFFEMENLNHKKIFVNGILDGIKRELIIED